METNNISSNLSQREKIQLEKFKEYKLSIEEILQRLEKEYEIKIIYACESGSRGLGIDVDDSDFDITGFFIPQSSLEYYKIIPKFTKTIKLTQEKIIIGEINQEIDIDIIEFKEWLGLKISKNYAGGDFWFESSLIYRNLYPDIIHKIRKRINPPYLLYWGKAKSGIGCNEGSLKRNGNCLNKLLMNVLTSLFQYFHFQLYGTFPMYNILDEIDYLLSQKEFIIRSNTGFNDDDFNLFTKCVEVYLKLFEEKKINRKSTSFYIHKEVYDFFNLLKSKYDTKIKKSQLEIIMKEEWAQEIFDEILGRHEVFVNLKILNIN
jgi:hypothetical protein